MSEFQWFSGLGAKAAKAALEPLQLEPLDKGDGRLTLPGDRERLEAFQVPKLAQYALVASLDGVSLLKRNTRELIDPEDLRSPLFRQKGYAGESLNDRPSHGIVDRGRLIGLWEYDTETESIAWASLIGKNKDLVKAVEETEQYVRNELGDARSFSLDSPKSRRPRVEALRKAQ